MIKEILSFKWAIKALYMTIIYYVREVVNNYLTNRRHCYIT